MRCFGFYLRAALKTPATNNPAIPGYSPRVSMTRRGRSWSFALANCSHRISLLQKFLQGTSLLYLGRKGIAVVISGKYEKSSITTA